MRSGINLASHPHRGADVSPLVRWLPLAGVALLTVFHGYSLLAVGRRVETARRATVEREARLKGLVQDEDALRAALASGTGQDALVELASLEHARVRASLSPAAVLSEVARALPPRARTMAFAIRAEGGAAKLQLEIAAEEPEAASEVALQLARSRLLRNPELLDERSLVEGGYRFRLTADLVPGEPSAHSRERGVGDAGAALAPAGEPSAHSRERGVGEAGAALAPAGKSSK